MDYVSAGPSGVPGVIDVAILVATAASGLSVEYAACDGCKNYGKYDECQDAGPCSHMIYVACVRGEARREAFLLVQQLELSREEWTIPRCLRGRLRYTLSEYRVRTPRGRSRSGIRNQTPHHMARWGGLQARRLPAPARHILERGQRGGPNCASIQTRTGIRLRNGAERAARQGLTVTLSPTGTSSPKAQRHSFVGPRSRRGQRRGTYHSAAPFVKRPRT